jgi:prepilin-type N-terminal cleavage/methylation domain-containing protein
MSRLDTSHGFSLIEALIALAIVALIMTGGMSLIAQQSGILQRARAHQEALEVIETTLEAIRAGQLVVTSGRVRLPVTTTEADALVLWLEVNRRPDMPDLAEVLVEARYVVGSHTLHRKVRTMTWGAP